MEPWEFTVDSGGTRERFTIPVGYEFDKASVPPFFWGFPFNYTPDGLCTVPALEHDFLCDLHAGGSDWLRVRLTPLPAAPSQAAGASLLLVGYSWGAIISSLALRGAGAPPDALALVFPPLGPVPPELQPQPTELAPLRERLLPLGGSDDEYCPVEALARLATTTQAAARGCKWVVLDGVGHFLQGASADRAAQEVVSWLAVAATHVGRDLSCL